MDFNLLTSLNDNIRIDRNKCTACGRCVEVCVLDNLRLQLSPCRQACPLGMNCQGYIHQHGARCFGRSQGEHVFSPVGRSAHLDGSGGF